MKLRRTLAVAAALPVLAVAVLLVEIQLARRGPDLDEEPFDLDGRVGPSAGAAMTVVWLGDSTAAGVGASVADRTVPRQVAAALGRPVELRVLAISGARVADVVRRQVPALDGLDPDMVFVSVGANDATHATRLNTFTESYERLIASLPKNVKIVLLGVPDMGAPPRLAQPLRFFAGLNGRRMDSAVRAVADAGDHIYVDIEGATGPAFRRDPERYFAADRYHPSDEGYDLWTEAVVDALG